MTEHQIQLAMQLVQAMQRDPAAAADAAIYGDWISHLADHLTDIALETPDP